MRKMKISIFASERDQSIVAFEPLYMHNFCIWTSRKKFWTAFFFSGASFTKYLDQLCSNLRVKFQQTGRDGRCKESGDGVE